MKISVITINRNNSDGLELTINSVLSQTFREIEYIIVDGASSDDSVTRANQMINSYCGPICVDFRSEPDNGIYNAMNKGVQRAHGEYLLFMNSGDKICTPSTIADVFMNFDDGSDIIAGRVNILENGVVVNRDVGYKPNEKISLYDLYLLGFAHQGAFIKKSLLLQHPYDESYKINSDWKFFAETLILENASLSIIPYTIADYDTSGISSKNKELLLEERKKNFHELFPPRIVSDYEKVFPHYYECKRVAWLLRHRLFYFVYRSWATFGMKILK